MRSIALLGLAGLVACHPKPKVDAHADAGAAPTAAAVTASAAPPLSPARASSLTPMLAARLDGERVAILLGSEDAKKNAPGPLVIHARSPILTIGAPIDVSALPVEARRHLDGDYAIHGAAGEVCAGILEGVAVVHRIPADDPVAGRSGPESDADYAKRVYESSDQEAIVALAHASGCRNVLWAVPKAAPPASDVAVHVAPKITSKKLAPVLRRDDAFQSFAADGNFEATYTSLGDEHVWVHAKSGANASCFLTVDGAHTTKLVGSVGACPAPVRAATREGARMYVWFDRARALLDEGKPPDITYFPTASFAASER